MVDGDRFLTLVEFLDTVQFNSKEALTRAVGSLPPPEPKARAEETNSASNRRDFGKELLPCAAKMLSEGPGDGPRRPALFRLAAHLNRAGYPQVVAEVLVKEADAQGPRPILDEFGDKELKHHIKSAYKGKKGTGYISLGCDEIDWISRFCVGRENCPIYSSDAAADFTPVGAPKGVTASALLKKELLPINWIIPSILPAGLTIFAGPPKLGKSWFVLGLSIAVASGGKFLNSDIQRGEVAYLALEDNERRLQSRLQLVLNDEPGPEGLHLFTEWRRDDHGGVKDLGSWVEEHPDCRLVIIDTLQKIKKNPGRNRNAYENDYLALGA